jgi:predicted component of type VI protein secretion system
MSNRIHTFFHVKQPGAPERIVVWDTQEITLGRSPENDITVDHGEVSRRHAQFVCTGKSYVLQNLNTSNGTLVNGQGVTTHTLKSRDLIQIAELELTFYQSPKDPVSLGMKVEYASQFKGFPGGVVAGGDAEATMLGLGDPIGGPDEDFQVRSAGDFAYDLHEMESAPVAPPVSRDLDEELADFGLDDLDIEGPAAAPAGKPAQPTARKGAALSLHLTIQGLEGELRQALQGLVGKTIELPSLRIKVVDDDLA